MTYGCPYFKMMWVHVSWIYSGWDDVFTVINPIWKLQPPELLMPPELFLGLIFLDVFEAYMTEEIVLKHAILEYER